VNQHAQALNAFITPLPRAGQWLDRVKEADQRREQGTPTTSETYPFTGLNLTKQYYCDRKTQVRSRRALDLD
jgi:hypothetical protein